MRDYREALERLAERARQEGCCAEAQIPMASLTTFRIGGPCGILFTASNPETAALLLRCCAEEEVPLLILGNGSNLLVSDKGIPGAVLRLSSGEIRFEKDRVICPAGVPLKALCRAVRDRGLAGLEFAYGIPGTVGGAVFMNAGAYGGEMKDVLLRAAACDSAGNRREYRAEEMELRYRHSRFMKEQLLVLEAELQLMPDEKITATIPIKEYEDGKYLFMATRRGLVKKTPIKEYMNVRKTGLAAIVLREDDLLIEVKVTDNDQDILLVTKSSV